MARWAKYRDNLSLSNRDVSIIYTRVVPKLWTQTIESHRREVRDAILNTTAKLVEEDGLLSVTMSRIAEETGIGRATLYKYFPDVESILRAWHGRQISTHLEHLAAARDRASGPIPRLEAVLEAYALISMGSRGHRDAELAALLHRDEQVPLAEKSLRAMIRELLVEGAQAGKVRRDVAPEELVSYCLYAVAAATSMRSKASVHRLVAVTLAGLRPGSRVDRSHM